MFGPQITGLPAVGPPAAVSPPRAGGRGVPVPASNASDATESGARMRQVARQVADSLRSIASGLEFSVDESSGRVLVRVRDKETNELIRQIPSEEMLAIRDALDRLQGLLLRQKA